MGLWHTGGVSQEGDWDKFKGWVPGDPLPGEVPDDAPRQRPTPPPPPGAPPVGRSHGPTGVRSGGGPQQTTTGGVGVIAAALLVLVLGAAGVAAFAAFATTSTEVVEVDVVGAPSSPPPPGSGTADGPEAMPVDLLRGSIQPLFDALEPELGTSFRVKGLTVYPDYALLEVEPPQLPGEIDRWMVHLPDRLSGPDPVSNPGEVEASLFWVSDLDPALLATLPARAEAVLAPDIPDGVAGYFVIDRSSSDGDVVAISVYVRGERRSGYVRFTATGEELRRYGG